MRVLVMSLILLSVTPALAGRDDRSCESVDKSVVLTNDLARVEIKFTAKDGNSGVHEAPLRLFPAAEAGAGGDKGEIWAVPISAERTVSHDARVQHVLHKDGSDCYGRMMTDDVTVQSFVLMGKGAGPLSELFANKKVPGLLPDGYLVVQLHCRHSVVTTAAGCRVSSDQDIVRIEPVKPSPSPDARKK